MSYLFTSEAVSEGHPDKIADQIADAILDQFLALDPESRVACEVMVTRGLVVLAGEVTSKGYVDIDSTVRATIDKVGYNSSELQFDACSCGVLSAIHEQSSDIARGVDRAERENQGAGDQGMMFGYACNETSRYMPLTTDISNAILKTLAELRRSNEIPYLRPDAKSQVTVEYSENHEPLRIDTIVISTQHDEFITPETDTPEARAIADEKMRDRITADIEKLLIPKVRAIYGDALAPLFDQGYRLLVNPTGKFVLGGPAADTGVTGRKIIADTYGGRSGHGGGAFSGKDPSKVDRSACYAMRYLAKNLVAAGVADQVSLQIAYAIGKAEPVSIYVNTYGTSKVSLSDGEIAKVLAQHFDLRPYAIEKMLNLRQPIYSRTASYGHFGRNPQKTTLCFKKGNEEIAREVELFTWEKLDLVPQMKTIFHVD